MLRISCNIDTPDLPDVYACIHIRQITLPMLQLLHKTVVVMTHFYQRNTFVYSLNVLNVKGMSSVNTSLSLKYNKTLKALPLCLYKSIQLLVRVS